MEKFEQYCAELSKEELRNLYLALRQRMILEHLIYEKGKYVENEFILCGKSKMEQINKTQESVKTYIQELLNKQFILIHEVDIEKFGFKELINKGDMVTLLMKRPSDIEQIKAKVLKQIENDKTKMTEEEYEKIRKANQPTEVKDNIFTFRSGGFVNSIDPKGKWFSVKGAGASISFQISYIHAVLIKPLGKTRRDKLNYLLKGIPIPKKKEEPKPEDEKPKTEAKVAGIEKEEKMLDDMPKEYEKILSDL